jgi:hypothetical protein
MRDVAPRGDALYTFAVSATTSLTELVGGNIDVPSGHIAILHASVRSSPSGNTLGWGFLVDGAQVTNPQESTNGDRYASYSTKVGPGKHRVGVWGVGSTSAGSFSNICLDYVIVRKDSGR